MTSAWCGSGVLCTLTTAWRTAAPQIYPPVRGHLRKGKEEAAIAVCHNATIKAAQIP